LKILPLSKIPFQYTAREKNKPEQKKLNKNKKNSSIDRPKEIKKDDNTIGWA
jgi:hypothetical protein